MTTIFLHKLLGMSSHVFSLQQRLFSCNYRDLVREYKPLLPPKGASILDIGCGTADCAMILLDGALGYRYTGTDFNPSYIKNNRRRFPQANFVLSNGLDAKIFHDNSYNCVLIFSILHHLSDVECAELLTSIQRILIKGGSILTSEPLFWEREGGMTNSQRISNLLLRRDRGRYIRHKVEYHRFFGDFLLEREMEYVYTIHRFWGARYLKV